MVSRPLTAAVKKDAPSSQKVLVQGNKELQMFGVKIDKPKIVSKEVPKRV
jgi:hypothetical protein